MPYPASEKAQGERLRSDNAARIAGQHTDVMAASSRADTLASSNGLRSAAKKSPPPRITQDKEKAEDHYSVAKARSDFGKVLNKVHYQDRKIVIEKHDEPHAVVMSLGTSMRLEQSDEAIRTLAAQMNIPCEVMKDWLNRVSSDHERLKALRKVIEPKNGI